jgi:G2/mitotic-specific cyclin 2
LRYTFLTSNLLQARPARQRVANIENDENAGSTRLTRAAAAKLSIDDISSVANVQKPLQSKKSSTTIPSQEPAKKRAVLGDRSNITKGEALVDGKAGKKAVGAAKSGLVSKASQSAGISKQPRAAPRNVLAAKDKNKSSEITRPASGSGVGGPIKRKQKALTTAAPIKEETPVEEDEDVEEPARKKVHTAKSERQLVKVFEEEKVEVVEPEPKEVAEPVEDLDKDDGDDPLMAAEYVVEIFQYLNELEVSTAPNPNYMDHQEDLEWKMRGILVDWLIEVHTRFHLLPETLFLAVNIIDRFLSEKVVNLDRLQLVGVTAMFIASKYEEVLSPHVGNFRHVADDGFTEEEILSAERFILSALDYDLSYPNPMNFLRRISKADDYDIHTRTVGKFIMEISLLDHRFMEHRPSHVAAAAMYLSRQVMDKGPWVSYSCSPPS